jgi:hypothetical protein
MKELRIPVQGQECRKLSFKWRHLLPYSGTLRHTYDTLILISTEAQLLLFLEKKSIVKDWRFANGPGL